MIPVCLIWLVMSCIIGSSADGYALIYDSIVEIILIDRLFSIQVSDGHIEDRGALGGHPYLMPVVQTYVHSSKVDPLAVILHPVRLGMAQKTETIGSRGVKTGRLYTVCSPLYDPELYLLDDGVAQNSLAQ